MASPSLKFLGYGGALPEAILQFAKKLAACQIENMKKLFPAVGVVLVALFAVSCAPKTPSYRISQRPEAYERLSEKHKQLVSKGEIAEGMEKAAVALAWGSPKDLCSIGMLRAMAKVATIREA